MEKTALVCYVCRQKFCEVHLNTTLFFEVAFDFCPSCEELMRYDFERQMLGLEARPLQTLKKPKLRLEGVKQVGT